jgi:hypothetical protein
MYYVKGKGIIDVAGRKVRSKHEQDLILARIHGQKGELSEFTRLRIESRVASTHLVAAYQAGCAAREARP